MDKRYFVYKKNKTKVPCIENSKTNSSLAPFRNNYPIQLKFYGDNIIQ